MSVSDLTYVAPREDWLDLAVKMDLYSQKIEGWAVSETMKTTVVRNALERATQNQETTKGAIYHSERDCQYTSAELREILKDLEMQQSMNAQGYC